MHSSALFRRVLSIGFLLGVFTPFVFSLPGISNVDPERFQKGENRLPYEYPTFRLASLASFPAQFEDAFGDRFGFREQFVKIYNMICYQLFNVLNNEQLLAGEDDYVFLGSHSSKKGTRGSAVRNVLGGYANEQSLNNDAELISGYRTFFEHLNTRVLLVSMPTKPYLEFERLPEFIRQKYPSYKTEMKRARLLETLPRDFVDEYILFPLDRAVSENAIAPLIPEKNFHWTVSRYTRLVASSIAEKFGVEAYSPPRMSDYLKIQTRSDLNHFSKAIPMNENSFVYKQDYFKEHGVVSLNPAVRYPDMVSMPPSKYAENKKRKGRILIIGELRFPPKFGPSVKVESASLNR